MHLALKHQKIIEFVPQEVSELFYPVGTTTATEDSRKNSTDNNELAVVHRKICKKDKKSPENSPGNTYYDVTKILLKSIHTIRIYLDIINYCDLYQLTILAFCSSLNIDTRESKPRVKLNYRKYIIQL